MHAHPLATVRAYAAERAFSTDLPSDKSLDEVILEYLPTTPGGVGG